MNLANWIKKWSQISPNKCAIIDNNHIITYYDLHVTCNRLSNYFLSIGVKKSTKIGVLLQNGHEFIEIYFAAARIGAIMVPLNWRTADPEIAGVLEDAEAGVLIFSSEFSETAQYVQEKVHSIQHFIVVGDDVRWPMNYSEHKSSSPSEPSLHEAIDVEDAHLLLYTSGTTGGPKGAVLPYRKTFYNALNADIFYGLTSSDVFLVSRPLFHSGGLLVDSTPIFYKGATAIYKKKFTPEDYLKSIENYKVTIIETSATFLNFILQECNIKSYNLSSLKSAYTGGERVSEALLAQYHKLNIPLSQIFGMTETSIISWLPAKDAVRKIGSVGKPVFHGELKIQDKGGNDVKPGDIGEILISGPILMSGYWRKPDLTHQLMEKGWFHTGDLATIDEEGFIYIVDRSKDMFISGGENVYPAEIEKLLLKHPKIFDVAVFGVPDSKWGEVGMATVVCKRDTSIGKNEILGFLQGRIGKYKIPKHIRFVDQLPKTASGKIRKYELKEMFGGRMIQSNQQERKE